MKNNISYYRHNIDSHNHWKFKTLRRKYSWAGEGRFWALNNIIAESENCLLDISDESKIEWLACELDLEPKAFLDFLFYLVKTVRLVKQNDNYISTEMTQEVLIEVNKKRDYQKNWARNKKEEGNEGSGVTTKGAESEQSFYTQSNFSKTQSNIENNKSNIENNKSNIENNKSNIENKQSKVNKIREEIIDREARAREAPFIQKNSSFLKPCLEDVINYANLIARQREDAEDFFYHYEAQGWIRGNSQPIQDWKPLFLRWKPISERKNNNGNNKSKESNYSKRLSLTVQDLERSAINGQAYIDNREREEIGQN